MSARIVAGPCKWTSSTGEREHLEQLIEVGVTQVMVPARPPEQLEDRYAQLIVDYDLEASL